MWLLILGFVLFLGACTCRRVCSACGRNWWTGSAKGVSCGLYIATSVTGMLCIGVGMWIAPFVGVWDAAVLGREARRWCSSRWASS